MFLKSSVIDSTSVDTPKSEAFSPQIGSSQTGSGKNSDLNDWNQAQKVLQNRNGNVFNLFSSVTENHQISEQPEFEEDFIISDKTMRESQEARFMMKRNLSSGMLPPTSIMVSQGATQSPISPQESSPW